MIERRLNEVDVVAALAFEEGDHRARIGGNHPRSSRKRRTSIENFTRPRSIETRRNATRPAVERQLTGPAKTEDTANLPPRRAQPQALPQCLGDSVARSALGLHQE